MQKLLYIAGPYSGKDYIEVSRNILQAQECAIWLASNNIFFFCPHTHSSHNDIIMPNVEKEFWLQLDMTILGFCDGIVLLPGWGDSEGSKKELEFAENDFLFISTFPEGKAKILLWAKE